MNIICSVCLQFPEHLCTEPLCPRRTFYLLNERTTLNNKSAESEYCNAKKLDSGENERGGGVLNKRHE